MSAATPEPAAPPTLHAVARQRARRLAASSKPYLARGGGLVRCSGCRLPATHCICALRPVVPSNAGFCLLLGDIEALKPTNTGWLIADVVPDTWAFGWSRTEVDPALLALLADPRWRPQVVFPTEYAAPSRAVTAPVVEDGRRPLFVLLDGTWSEARKMFRKSPWLDSAPVLGLQAAHASRYQLRRSAQDHHFCTAEVAAMCLDLAGDAAAADALDAWFGLFSERYLSARCQLPLTVDSEATRRVRALSDFTRPAQRFAAAP